MKSKVGLLCLARLHTESNSSAEDDREEDGEGRFFEDDARNGERGYVGSHLDVSIVHSENEARFEEVIVISCLGASVSGSASCQ